MNKTMGKLMLMSLLFAGLLSACNSTKTMTLPGAQLTETKKSDGTEVESVKGADGSEDSVTTKTGPDGSESISVTAKQADGTEIKMDLSGTGEVPGMPVINVKTADGTTVSGNAMGGGAGTAYSPDFPLKQYPGSTVGFCGVNPKELKARAELSTTDPVANVDKFYRDELRNNGWKIVNDSRSSIPDNKGTDRLANMVHLSLTAHKDTRVAEIMILDATEGSPATISLDLHKRYMGK